MNKLIPINVSDTGDHDVLAYDLWEALDRPYTQFSKWFAYMLQYGFVENIDFEAIRQNFLTAQGNNSRRNDYRLSLDMAKELAMLQRTEKGKMIRQYLISIENAWNSPDLIVARAMQITQQQIGNLEAKVKELAPKGEFYDAVTGSRTALPFEQAAKVLGYRGVGRNKLFAFLRECGVLRGNNIPYQEYIDRGYFRVIEGMYTKPNGDVIVTTKTLIFQRGLDHIRKKLNKAGYECIQEISNKLAEQTI